MNTKNIITYLLFSILIFIAILFCSCRTNNVGFKPNYGINYYENSPLIRLNTKVVKVYDNRPKIGQYSNKYLGYVLTGATNKKTPYLIEEPLADYVRKFVNTLIDSSNSEGLYVPITITIETFKVYEVYDTYKETGYVKCALNFSYPVNKDSFNVIYTNTLKEISSKSDVTDLIDIIVYDAVISCTEKFVKEFDKSEKFYIDSMSDFEVFTNKVEKPKDLNIEFDNNNIDSEKKFIRSITLNYLTGNLIKSSFNLFVFTNKYEKGEQFFQGLGFGFNFLNVDNVEKNYKGGIYGLMCYYGIRYFTFKSLQGPYFSVNLSFLIGPEIINNKYNYFFGTLLKESIGLKIGPILLEAGLFQVSLIGSDLLPSDLGYSLGAGFQF